jgi:hypothetical protein
MGVMLGIGLATHMLAWVAGFLMFVAFREFRPVLRSGGKWKISNWKPITCCLGFMVLYVYLPITNRPPYMWFPSPSQVNTFISPIADTINTIIGLNGQISIWDFPKRILDTIGITGVSIAGVLAVPVVYYFVVQQKRYGVKWYKSLMFWLCVTPLTLFATDLDPNTYDYVMPAIPFLVIAGFVGLDYLVQDYRQVGKYAIVASCIAVVGFGVYNVNGMGIGRTEDKNLSATNFYYNELAKVPDGQILMPNYDWEWEAIFMYDKEFGRNIIPVCKGILPAANYQAVLESEGIKLVNSENPQVGLRFSDIAKSIVELNDNVWTTVSTEPETYGTEVVKTNGDTSLITEVDRNVLANINHPGWRWIPDNPYDIITCRIGVQKWCNVILSNYNVLTMTMLGAIGAVPCWIVWMAVFKKKKWSLNKKKEVTN